VAFTGHLVVSMTALTLRLAAAPASERRMRIALVGCVKSKHTSSAFARDLYTSPLFRAMRRYAESNADAWYVLSAEHGLVGPDRSLEPYERSLNTMPSAERLDWARRVQNQLLEVLPKGAEVSLLAGLRYREHLVPFLKQQGFSVAVPLEGLSLGRQLQRLKQIYGSNDDRP
jgi:hypothetical protein